ncbi:hypothetical protein CEXT_240561 [Caerostris extrusa]|uniref:Uncharacterized protein n=1 Tax=Caerostris extrusa TaxID=172846 RepID=A0AAV4QFI9_CAEEX|nr:hypothetical protein CEXT_240561 [Caerostris extrusa]
MDDNLNYVIKQAKRMLITNNPPIHHVIKKIKKKKTLLVIAVWNITLKFSKSFRTSENIHLPKDKFSQLESEMPFRVDSQNEEAHARLYFSGMATGNTAHRSEKCKFFGVIPYR